MADETPDATGPPISAALSDVDIDVLVERMGEDCSPAKCVDH